jgi:hypothetical protein
MSYAYDRRKKNLRKQAGKSKRSGYWELKKTKKGYVPKWYGI